MRNLRGSKVLVPLITAAMAVGCGGGTKETAPGQGGGSSSNTAKGTFTQVGSLATGRVGHTATLIPNSGKVLIVGGKGRAGSVDAVLDSAELFDPATGRFTPVKGTLVGGNQAGKRGRMAHGAAALATGEVIIAGGQTDVAGTSQLATVEYYNPLSDSFVAITGSLAGPKSDPIVIPYVKQGVSRVMIAGGRVSSNPQQATAPHVSVKTANIILGDTKQLQQANFQLVTGRYGASFASIAGGEFVIQGGISRDSAGSTPVVAGFEVFDPVAEQFKQSNNSLPGNSNKSLNTNRFAAPMALLGNAAAVFGGRDNVSNPNAVVGTIEFYSESTNAWTVVTASLKTPRSNHAAVKLANGDILIIGGRSATGQILNTTEIVSGSGVNAKVVDGPVMAVARENCTATLLQNGQVLVVGGENLSGPVAQAEIFALPNSTVIGAGQGQVIPGGAGAPSGLTLTPTSGAVGTQVRITASSNNFSLNLADNIVRFNGVVAPVQSATSNQLTVNVPNGATTGEVSVQIGTAVSTGNPVFTVTSSTTGGGSTPGTGTSPFSGPPRIFLVLPSDNSLFFAMPITITGSNFDNTAIPFFTNAATGVSIPSLTVWGFSLQNIPLVGSVATILTIVPPGAPPGPAYVQLQNYGVMSNQFPFTIY